MARWLAILVRTLRSTIRTQRELALENLALRQQVAVWKVRQPRPQLRATDLSRSQTSFAGAPDH
jgi:putative transposase